MSTPIDTASVAIVPDFSGFAREVSRGIDAALRSVLSDVRQAFAQVERVAADAGREVGQDFQRGGETAERALREVSRTAATSMAQVSASANAAGTSLSTRLAGAAAIAKGALLALGVAAGVGLAAIVGFGLKSAASIEQVQIGFEALLGSAQAAKSFMEELQSFSAATPFEFAGVADASRRILAFGQSVGIAKDEVIPVITTIGNLVSVLGGTQESVDAVVRAFGQIASKGRLMGGEILQIAEALPGFNANQAIAAGLGVSVAEAMEAQEAGTVDATTAINALLAGMAQFPGAAGAMAKQAETLLGVFSTFKDTISIALTNAFQPVIPAIKESLAELTPVLGEAINQLAPVLGGLVSSLLPILGQLVQAIVPVLMPILDALSQGFAVLGPALFPLGIALGAIAQALAPVLPMIADLAATLAGALVPIIYALVPAFSDLIDAVLPLIMDVLTPLIPVITQVVLLLAKLLLPVVGLVGKIFEKLGPPVLEIVMALADLLMPVIEALAPVIGQLITAFLPVLDVIVALLPPLVDIIKAFMPLTDVIVALIPAAVAIITPLARLVALIVGFLAQKAIVPLVELLAKAITLMVLPLTLLVPLLDAFTGFITGLDWGAIGSAIGGFFVDAWNKVKQFFAFIGKAFVEFPESVKIAFQAFALTVFNKTNEVIAFVRSIPGRVVDAIGNFGSLLVQKGRDLITGLWNGISSMGGWLFQKVKDFAYNNTVGAIKRGLGIASPSKVMAAQVGRWIPPGIVMGMEQTTPGLLSQLNSLAGNMTASAGSVFNNRINVSVMFSGVIPTAEEANRTGRQVAAGIDAGLNRRGIALAVRMG